VYVYRGQTRRPHRVRARRSAESHPSALLPRARELVAEFEAFATFVAEIAHELPRAVTVGFPPLLHPIATSTLMNLISARMPPLKVQYRPFPNAELVPCLQCGELDLALIHQYVPTPRIDAVQVLSERIGVAVPADHVPPGGIDVALEDLADLVYVTSENVSAPMFYRRSCRCAAWCCFPRPSSTGAASRWSAIPGSGPRPKSSTGLCPAPSLSDQD
jgi:DNA-binding transcriptional LysR family regulator